MRIILITLLLCPFHTFAIDAPAYWVWAGISDQHYPQQSELYVYQGIIIGDRFIRKGLYPHPIDAKNIIVTIRIDKELPDPKALAELSLSIVNKWENHNVLVSGIQLDFDSPTSKLLIYSEFLRKFRAIIPQKYRISITGLGDWILSGDQVAINNVLEATDEVVFQLYQGRKPLYNIERYVDALSSYQTPFKVGFLLNSNYNIHLEKLKNNVNLRGAVLFIQR